MLSKDINSVYGGIPNLNERVLAMARELCITSEYLFDIAVEMAEEELGEGLYDE